MIPGKYRVIGVDTFDGEDWEEGTFDTREEAITHADKKVAGKDMLKMHVYDPQGKHCYQCGRF